MMYDVRPTNLCDDVSGPAIALAGQLVPVVVQLLQVHLAQAGHVQLSAGQLAGPPPRMSSDI